MTQRTHTHSGRTAGSTIGTEEYTAVLGDAASRTYVDLSALGYGAPGNIAAAGGRDSSGTGTALSAIVNDSSPGTVGLAFTIANRVWIHQTPGAAMDLVAPRNSTNKVASLKLGTDRVLSAWYGGGGTSPTTEVQFGIASRALAVGEQFSYCFAVQAGATHSTGKAYCKAWVADGTVLLDVETTTGALGITNVVSANHGKMVATTGQIIWDDAVVENAYNKTLTPVPIPVVVTHTERIKRESDFAGSGSGTLSVAQASGPTVTPVVSGLVVSFVEIERTADVVLNYTFTPTVGDAQTGTITFPPGTQPTRRVGPLVKINGVLT